MFFLMLEKLALSKWYLQYAFYATAFIRNGPLPNVNV